MSDLRKLEPIQSQRRALRERAAMKRAPMVLTDEMVHGVAQRVQACPLPERSQEWTEEAAHKERIVQRLEAKRPLRLSRIHTLLVRDQGLAQSPPGAQTPP